MDSLLSLPALTDLPTDVDTKLDQYSDLLAHYTKKLNLISPTTITTIRERHINHCLLLRCLGFPDGVTVVDWGSGGGLPAIPLALVFPNVQFVSVDSVGKKMHAVRAMARQLKLTNLEAWHGRAEKWDGEMQYSVSRATAPLLNLWSWHSRCVVDYNKYGDDHWKPGLICLKGGDLTQEIDDLKKNFSAVSEKKWRLEELTRAFDNQDKYIVHIC